MENSFRKTLSVESALFEKLNNLLLFLFESMEFFGHKIEISNTYFNKYEDKLFGSKNCFELGHLFFALQELKYIEPEGTFPLEDEEGFTVVVPQNLSLTIEGIKHSNSLLISGINSNYCFVAMAFKNETEKLFESIKKVCEVNSFNALRVDKENIESEKTINDFIIASIKASRFCIADFTYNRLGVYFEAGYALGRGLKVIYTCHEDHFKDLHFDLKPLQFIVYKDEKELEVALDLKIKSFILS